MIRDLKIAGFLFVAALVGLNCASCADLTRAMPYVNAGSEMLCASLDAVKNSRILNAKQRVSEIEFSIAATEDIDTVLRLMGELEKARVELADALKDAEQPAP